MELVTYYSLFLSLATRDHPIIKVHVLAANFNGLLSVFTVIFRLNKSFSFPIINNSMAYGTQRFDAAFISALQ